MIGVWGFSCLRCEAVYEMEYTEDEAHLLENLAEDGACVHCGGQLKIMLVPPPESVPFEKTSASDYWKFRINGLGSSEERVWGCERVRQLLELRVVGADLVESETHRCVIRSLSLESGHVLHFAVGFGEAVIYKITEEKDHDR